MENTTNYTTCSRYKLLFSFDFPLYGPNIGYCRAYVQGRAGKGFDAITLRQNQMVTGKTMTMALLARASLFGEQYFVGRGGGQGPLAPPPGSAHELYAQPQYQPVTQIGCNSNHWFQRYCLHDTQNCHRSLTTISRHLECASLNKQINTVP